MTRSVTTSGSPSSFEDLDARRSHWSSVAWASQAITTSAASRIRALSLSYSARDTSLAYLSSDCL